MNEFVVAVAQRKEACYFEKKFVVALLNVERISEYTILLITFKTIVFMTSRANFLDAFKKPNDTSCHVGSV